MIQKLVFSDCKIARTGYNRLRNSWCNKDLSFFLVKKKFFLYKGFSNLKKKFSARGDNRYTPYFGPDNFYGNIMESLLTRLRSDRAILRVSTKKFIFYRIKKRFSKINKIARFSFFKYLGIKMFRNDFSHFFLSTKNVEKRTLFIHLVKRRSTKSVLDLLERSFGSHNCNNSLLFLNSKSGMNSLAISKHMQLHILSDYKSFILKKVKPVSKSPAVPISRSIVASYKKRRYNKAKALRMQQFVINSRYVDPFLKKTHHHPLRKRFLLQSNSILIKEHLFNISKSIGNFPTEAYKLDVRSVKRKFNKRRSFSIIAAYGKRGLLSGRIRERILANRDFYHNNLPTKSIQIVSAFPDRSMLIRDSAKIKKARNLPRSKKKRFKRAYLLSKSSVLKKKNFTKLFRGRICRTIRSSIGHVHRYDRGTKMANRVHIGGQFFDPRQLVAFPFRKLKNNANLDTELLGINLFNYRSYNWGIIT